MIQLSSVLWLSILTFAIIGYLRGFDKELIALAGVVLALFILVQFNDFFENVASGGGNPLRSLYYLQALVIVAVTFFGYQTNPSRFVNLMQRRSARDSFQSKVLGTLTGGFNGYLVMGSLWYFMDIKGYPFESVTPPLADTASAGWIDNLPMNWLLEGNLLTLLVVGLFLFILVAII